MDYTPQNPVAEALLNMQREQVRRRRLQEQQASKNTEATKPKFNNSVQQEQCHV